MTLTQQPGKTQQTAALRTGVKHRVTIWVALLVLLPLLVNGPVLLGFLDSNPELLYSSLATGVHKGPLPGLPLIDPNIGFTFQALQTRATDELIHGVAPWWNPYEGAGVPLAGEMQSAAFFPLTPLVTLPQGATLMRCALEILAGLGVWFLLRRLGVCAVGSFAGAALYEFTGSLAWLGGVSCYGIPSLPFLLLGIEYARSAAQQRRVAWFPIAVPLALSLYAGFPETAYLDALLAAVWSVARLPRHSRQMMWRYLINVVAGTAAGVLLAMPILVAFFDYVQVANVGGHHGNGFGQIHLDIRTIPQLILPYVYGPIFLYSSDTGMALTPQWGSVGGYAGVGLAVLALGGIFSNGRRAIRAALTAWLVLTLGASFGVPIVQGLLTSIPAVSLTAYFRYAPPSWALALCLLAAFMIDAASRCTGHVIYRRIDLGVAATLLALGFGTAAAARDMTNLLAVSGYTRWFAASLLGGMLIIAALASTGLARNRRLRALLLSSIVITEAAVYYEIPVLANPTKGTLSLGGVAFLRSHLNHQRFYTLGPIAPNYGSLFGIATINYNDLPISSVWSNFVHDRLDPYVSPITFNGVGPLPTPTIPGRDELLRQNIYNFETAGVKYIVDWPGVDPFSRVVTTPVIGAGNKAVALRSGQTATILVPGTPSQKQLFGIGVLIGTYNGRADGQAIVKVCSAKRCAVASRSLRDAADNEFLRFTFGTPLLLGGGVLNVVVRDAGGRNPMAIWLYPPAAGSAQVARAGKLRIGNKAAKLQYVYKDATSSHMAAAREALDVPVYQDDVMSIYELAHPAPYFRARGCNVHVLSRLRVVTRCRAAGRLVRLETFMPGWTAVNNGTATKIQEENGAFEAIAVPKGLSETRFAFTPPFLQDALFLLLGGLLLLGLEAYLRLRPISGVQKISAGETSGDRREPVSER